MERFNVDREQNFVSFEEQFNQKEKIESLGGVIEVIDIQSEKPKTEVPVLFAPGWGETYKTFKDSLEEMSDLGRRVLSLSHARDGGNKEEVRDNVSNITERFADYPADELRKALTLLAVLGEKNIEKIDVVAHSEGAINTVIAASLNPEKFRNIVLVGPGGLIGPDKFPKLAGRFSLKLINNFVNGIIEPGKSAALLRGGKETLKYISRNLGKSLEEAVAISGSEIHDMLRELHEQGMGIAVISGVDDQAFPMDKMQEVVKKDQLDGFYSVKGGHDEIWVHPEKYVALADQALTVLEEKHNREVEDAKEK